MTPPITALPVASRAEQRAELATLARPHRRVLVAAVALLVVAAGLSLLFPLASGWIVDLLSAGHGAVASTLTSDAWLAIIVLAVSVVLSGCAEYAGRFLLARGAERIIAALRERYVDRVLRLPAYVAEAAGDGDAVARSSSDVRALSDTVPRVLPGVVAAGFTMLLAMVAMVVIDVRFAGAVLLVALLVAATLRWYLGNAPAVYAAERVSESARSQQVLETVGGLATVRAFGMGGARRRTARESTWELVRWAMRARIVQNRLFGRVNATEAVGLIAVLVTGAVLVATGQAGVGQVTTETLLFLRMIVPVTELLQLMDDLQSAGAALARIIGVVRAQGTRETTASPRKLSGLQQRATATSAEAPAVPGSVPAVPADAPDALSFRAVRFGYVPDRDILPRLDLRIRRGERVAFTGASGSGKTTIARLAVGDRTPHDGRIRYGVPRDAIVLISQEHHIFAGTLRENLLLGSRAAVTDADIRDALQVVGAEDLLAGLSKGLDTVVGAHATPIAAGQAQQIALARVLLIDPPMVVLDEATAEAGTRSAETLDRAAQRVTEGRTALIIAHRLSQAAFCDRIVVLDEGCAVEEGTHDELVGVVGGRYASLWDAWAAGRDGNHPAAR